MSCATCCCCLAPGHPASVPIPHREPRGPIRCSPASGVRTCAHLGRSMKTLDNSANRGAVSKMSAKTMANNAQSEVPVAATGRGRWCWRRRRATAACCSSAWACHSSPLRRRPTKRPCRAKPPPRPRCRLAEAKARSVARAHPDALIIGSDQVADCDGRAVGKPGDHEHAVAHARAGFPASTVVFHTGLALLDAATGACQIGARRRSEHVSPAVGRRARGVPAPASSPTIAPAPSAPKASASRCSNASKATIRRRSSGCR